MKLTKLLIDHRHRSGLLQKEAAGLLGISREHYAQIESGRIEPSLRLLKTFSKKFCLNFEVQIALGECTFRHHTSKSGKDLGRE